MPRQPLAFTDDFFVIAHDPETDHRLLHDAVLGLGLAAGLLCELVVQGWANVANGRLYPVRHGSVPEEPLQHRISDLIRTEPERWPVDVWLRFLSPDAHDLVGDRLVRTRRYRRETVSGGLLRRATVQFRAVDPAREAYTPVRLRAAVREKRVTVGDTVVLALAVATELTGAVPLWDDRSGRDSLSSLFRLLPVPLWDVVTHTQASVAHHVMTR